MIKLTKYGIILRHKNEKTLQLLSVSELLLNVQNYSLDLEAFSEFPDI